MRKLGVLVISHGSRNEEWVKLVRGAVADVGIPEITDDVPVECVFLELVEGYLIQDGIDRLELSGVTDMIVVPLFVSSGSTHMDEISWALGVKAEPDLPTDLQRFRMVANVHLCAPIDDDPEIAQLLVDKLKPLTITPEWELVLLVGHGSKENGFHERWQQGLESLAEQVQTIGRYAAVDTVMLLPNQASDKMKAWKNCRPELSVIIAPLFLSAGYFTNVVIPERFAGFPYRYNGATLLPSPNISRWMERRIASKVHIIMGDGDE
jgi:sirohydrochlorin ferrochelatase